MQQKSVVVVVVIILKYFYCNYRLITDKLMLDLEADDNATDEEEQSHGLLQIQPVIQCFRNVFYISWFYRINSIMKCRRRKNIKSLIYLEQQNIEIKY